MKPYDFRPAFRRLSAVMGWDDLPAALAGAAAFQRRQDQIVDLSYRAGLLDVARRADDAVGGEWKRGLLACAEVDVAARRAGVLKGKRRQAAANRHAQDARRRNVSR